ncbi:MAG: acyltransferase [Opitutae bacterium]|jgi:acetyltransferase-like isoleucine patch superfamily enzyme|nr:acyltransferase [Opitutae bacterium]
MWMKLKIRPFLRPIIRWLLYFRYETYYRQGNGRLRLGEKVGLANTLLNLASGNISIGSYTIFGQNVMVITGVHRFVEGKRAGLDDVRAGLNWGGGSKEAPSEGYDIVIGEGCWICSGAIILGPVKIGDNSIVGAGSVVTKDIPPDSFFAGIPAKYISGTSEMFCDKKFNEDFDA